MAYQKFNVESAISQSWSGYAKQLWDKNGPQKRWISITKLYLDVFNIKVEFIQKNYSCHMTLKEHL